MLRLYSVERRITYFSVPDNNAYLLLFQDIILHATGTRHNGVGCYFGRSVDVPQQYEVDRRWRSRQAQIVRQLRIPSRVLHARRRSILDDIHFR